jgi:hypothetical protein
MTEMTPEMVRNATPNNLKKLARLIKMGQPLQGIAVSEAIDLCASAWEADRKRLNEALHDAALEKRDKLQRCEEKVVLEARIEALASDKAAMRLEIVTIIGMYGDHMHPRVKQALEAVAAAYPSAALAAEEVPHETAE